MKIISKYSVVCCLLLIPNLSACQDDELQLPEHGPKESGKKADIPEGFIDAADLTIGEFSKLFKASVTEKALVKKFGKPVSRNVWDKGEIRLKYLFYNAGREAGMFVTGFEVFFNPKGRLLLWQFTYEQIETIPEGK